MPDKKICKVALAFLFAYSKMHSFLIVYSAIPSCVSQRRNKTAFKVFNKRMAIDVSHY